MSTDERTVVPVDHQIGRHPSSQSYTHAHSVLFFLHPTATGMANLLQCSLLAVQRGVTDLGPAAVEFLVSHGCLRDVEAELVEAERLVRGWVSREL